MEWSQNRWNKCAEAAKQINERQKMTQDVGVELEKVEDIDRVIEEAAGSRQDWKSQNGWLQHKGLFFSFFFVAVWCVCCFGFYF